MTIHGTDRNPKWRVLLTRVTDNVIVDSLLLSSLSLTTVTEGNQCYYGERSSPGLLTM